MDKHEILNELRSFINDELPDPPKLSKSMVSQDDIVKQAETLVLLRVLGKINEIQLKII